MPAMISMGSQGTDVMMAQAQLNLGATQLPRLSLDSIFGVKTKARTIEFQRASGLTADGIIGPKTWAALLRLQAPVAVSLGSHCGNGDEANQGRAAPFESAIRGGAIQKKTVVAGSQPVTANAMTIGGVQVKPIADTPFKAIAQSIYLDSLHYDRIFISTATGLQNRPFTLAVGAPPFTIDSLPFGGFIQILNVGANPTRDTIIHETAHAWQSQHHFHGGAYLANCLRCQKTALELNLAIGLVDPTVADTKKDWPGNHPISAYGYRPGAPFESYGGEQIAQQVEKGETPIIAHVATIQAGATSSLNVQSISPLHVRTEDLRAPGVKV